MKYSILVASALAPSDGKDLSVSHLQIRRWFSFLKRIPLINKCIRYFKCLAQKCNIRESESLRSVTEPRAWTFGLSPGESLQPQLDHYKSGRCSRIVFMSRPLTNAAVFNRVFGLWLVQWTATVEPAPSVQWAALKRAFGWDGTPRPQPPKPYRVRPCRFRA